MGRLKCSFQMLSSGATGLHGSVVVLNPIGEDSSRLVYRSEIRRELDAKKPKPITLI